MTKKKTILIFGVSSFLGSNLAEALKEKYRVVGTYYKNQVEIQDVLTLKCDVNNKEKVQKLVFLFKPDITVYAIGLSSLNDCDEFPRVADALNTAGVFSVSQASERYNSKFIYFSSSYVFAGDKTIYHESDSPTPLTAYGNSVASSEFYIQKSCLNYLIFRTAPLFGRSLLKNQFTFLEQLEFANLKHEKIKCDGKIYNGFIDVAYLISVFLKAVESNQVNRLFQVGTTDTMTHLEFAQTYFSLIKKNPTIEHEDWNFPLLDNHKIKGESEFYFQMDSSLTESVLQMKTPSVKDSLKSFLERTSQSENQLKNKLKIISQNA